MSIMTVRPWLAGTLVAVLAAAAVVHVIRRLDSAHKEENRRLVDAVRSKPLGAIEELLERGADPDARDSDGSAALHLAVRRGETAIVEALLRAGADVNATDVSGEMGDTPLDIAALNGHEGIVKLLLEHGANVGGYATSQRTPLSSATQGGDEQVVSLLIDKGADVNQPDSVYGWPPLFWAIRCDRPHILELLLRGGADVHFRIRSGETALDFAARRQRHSLAAILLANGAKMSLRSAAALGDVDAVKQLLGAGADVNSEDEAGVIGYAVIGGRADIVAALIAAGGNVNLKGPGTRSPLCHAVAQDNMEIARMLLEAGADVNTRGLVGVGGPDSALYHAVIQDNIEIARMLLEAGADVNTRGMMGETVLDIALRDEHEDMADLLREHGGKRLGELPEGRLLLGLDASSGD